MSVPIARSSYVSGSAEEAWDTVSQMYMQVRPAAAQTETVFSAQSAATMDVAVDKVRVAGSGSLTGENGEQLTVVSWLSGRGSADFGPYGQRILLPGGSALYAPNARASFAFETFDGLGVRLSLDLVAGHTAAATGLDPAAFRFTSIRPVTPRAERLWRKVSFMLWRELATPDMPELNPLVHRHLLEFAATVLITAFPNTAMTRGYVPGPGDVRPSAVRRAIAYIDAHASLPVTVTDIADAAGTSPRALREGFRVHLGTTPSAYLRRVRLEAAHHELQAADPTTGVTVVEVAARWGFRRLDRFTAAYHAAYGHPPARTLAT